MLNVYLVTDRLLAGERDELEIVRAALEAGVRVVQYREKQLTTRQQMEQAARIRRLVNEYRGRFLVNDRLDIALAVEADGVHLGQDDLPLHEARRILGPGPVIGVSVQNREEALEAQAGGADYLGVGALFSTPTKSEAPVVGLKGLQEIHRAVEIPLVAIGGINRGNALEVIAAGADGLAVVSAIVAAPDPGLAASQLVELARWAKEVRSGCTSRT
ncbi:MAG: thiamine phosphate synthase [Firmicutes bacterium]|nr:thiamine phosphate synthase [Bacillota bacterium]